MKHEQGGRFVKRVLAVLCSIVLLVVSMSGCGESKNANKTINIKLTAEPSTLDPQVAQGSDAATVISALYEGLCRLDSSGKAVPGVAESWKANSDSTEFTFNLRSNAVWNGNIKEVTGKSENETTSTPVTAQDFVFAWRRALDASTASPVCTAMMCIENAVQVHAGTLSSDKLGVTAKDSHTLVVKLRYTCPEFPQLTAQSVFMPCNEEFFTYAAGRYGMERATIFGNGPFSIPNYGWNHNQNLTAKRSSTYVGGTAALPSSLVFTIGDTSTSNSTASAAVTVSSSDNTSTSTGTDVVQSIVSGKMDIAPLDISSVSSAQKADLTVTSFQDTTGGLCFNTKGVFQSAALRRAFVQVLKRGTLLNLLPSGTQQADDILPPAIQFGGKPYRDQVTSGLFLKQSASAAVQGSSLLKKGTKVTLLCTEETKPLASEMLANWNQAFQTYFSLNAVDERTLLSSVISGSYDIAIYPYTPVSADAYTALACFQSGQSGNFTQLKDSSYDQLLSGSTVSSGALAQAEKYLNDNAVFYPLYYTKHAYAAQSSVTGVLYRPFGAGLDLRGAGKDN